MDLTFTTVSLNAHHSNGLTFSGCVRFFSQMTKLKIKYFTARVSARPSDDSDLLEPMRIVRRELRLPVGLVNPHKNPSFELRQHAAFIKQVRAGLLKASQFPATITDAKGIFTNRFYGDQVARKRQIFSQTQA